MARNSAKKRRTGARRRSLALRWVAVASLCLICGLYYRPVRTYLETRADLREQSAEVRALRAERNRLEARLTSTDDALTLLRGARKLGLVKPGERLVIVQNIDAWRRKISRAHTARDDRDG